MLCFLYIVELQDGVQNKCPNKDNKDKSYHIVPKGFDKKHQRFASQSDRTEHVLHLTHFTKPEQSIIQTSQQLHYFYEQIVCMFSSSVFFTVTFQPTSE